MGYDIKGKEAAIKILQETFELATGIKMNLNANKFFRETSVDENYVAENPSIASLWFPFRE